MPLLSEYSVLILILQLLVLFLLAQVLHRQLGHLLVRLVRSQKWAVALLASLFWPGTLIHELSHLLTARLLLVPAGGLTLIPQIKPDRIVMGQVVVPRVDPIRMFLIAIAPFLIGLSLLFGLLYWYAQQTALSWLATALCYYLIIQLSNTFFLSPADWRSTRRLLAILSLGLIILYAFNFLPTISDILSYLHGHQALFQAAVNLMWLPLLINSLLACSLLLLRRLLSR